jgi:ribosomal-protein-alanine N-acetyltransferase
MTTEMLAATHSAAFTTDRPWSAAEFAGLLAHPATILTGDVRAFVIGRVILDEAEILTLATDPAHRRQGLARAALDAFLRSATARGASRAFIEVAADNLPARALYASAGFSEIARRAAYYPVTPRSGRTTRADALILARTLPIDSNSAAAGSAPPVSAVREEGLQESS